MKRFLRGIGVPPMFLQRTRIAAGRTLAICLLAMATMLLTRCISAEEKDVVIYDAAKDEFRALMLLTDIQVKDDDDLAYLEAAYNNRDHWIAPVVPGGANVFPLAAVSLLRLGDTQVADFNLYASRPSAVDGQDIKTSVKDVRITPGSFFLQNKKVGYYQAIAVPGKVVDGAFAEMVDAMKNDLVAGIDKEINSRGEGHARHTWAEVKEKVLANMTFDQKKPEDSPANPMEVLDVESLKMMKAAAEKGTWLKRSKQSVVLSIPMTAADAKEADGVIKAVTARLDELVKTTKVTPEVADKIEMVKNVQSVMRSMVITADDKGLTGTLDVVAFTQSVSAIASKRVDMNQKEPPVVDEKGVPAPPQEKPGVEAYLREKKIPINDALTAEQVLKDFQAGTLKANASATPVKPGEGLPKPPAQHETLPPMPMPPM